MTKKNKKVCRQSYPKKPKKKKLKKAYARRTVSHPLYGEIPLIQVQTKDANGKKWTYWDYDPSYNPPMPARAVAGDVAEQVFCRICHVPKYFYVDDERKCIQCGKRFVFSAPEQKYWYETLKFNFQSTAIRCISCREKRRSDRAIRQQLQFSVLNLKKVSDDPLLYLALAEATVQCFDRFKEGDLNQAISACRRALRLSPTLFEAIFWEAACQERAERMQKAYALYTQFLKAARGVRRCRRLLKQAEKKRRETHT